MLTNHEKSNVQNSHIIHPKQKQTSNAHLPWACWGFAVAFQIPSHPDTGKECGSALKVKLLESKEILGDMDQTNIWRTHGDMSGYEPKKIGIEYWTSQLGCSAIALT